MLSVLHAVRVWCGWLCSLFCLLYTFYLPNWTWLKTLASALSNACINRRKEIHRCHKVKESWCCESCVLFWPFFYCSWVSTLCDKQQNQTEHRFCVYSYLPHQKHLYLILQSPFECTSKFIVEWWKWVLIKTLSTNSVSAPQFELTFIRQISIESRNLVCYSERKIDSISVFCCLSSWFLLHPFNLVSCFSNVPVFWIISMSLRSSFPFVSSQHSRFVLIWTFSTEFKLHSKKYVMAMFLHDGCLTGEKRETLKTKGKTLCVCMFVCVDNFVFDKPKSN